jgi:tetratricopeptide (TPR) repeat protein
VRDIPEVAGGLSAAGLKWMLTHGHVGQWHPLTTLSLMLDASLFGLDHPQGFHLDNLLLHALAAVLLFFAVRAMTGAVWRSVLVAAVFAVHPLRAESVAWIAERKDVLSGVFLAATLWAYAAYARRPFSLGRYAVLWVSFALGLLAKPMLVTLPAVLLLLDVWPLQRLDLKGGPIAIWRQACPLIIEKLPLLALSLAAAIVALRVMGETYIKPIPPLHVADRLAYIPSSYLFYLSKLVWPVGLAAHYPYSLHGPSTGQWLVALGLLLGLTTLALSQHERRPFITVGWLWFLVTLLPVVGFFYSGIQIRADRYTYVSQIGPAWAAVWWASAWLEARKTSLRARIAMAVVTVTVLATLCWRQTGHWRNDATLWNHVVAATKENFYAQSKLGGVLNNQHDPAGAEKAYHEALRIYPDGVEALNNLAHLLEARGEIDEAIALQRRAIALFPRWHTPHYNLGCSLLQKGSFSEAEECFLKALELAPDDFGSCNNLACLLAENPGDRASLERSVRYAERAARIRPESANIYATLGRGLYYLGRLDEAEGAFRQALARDPSNSAARQNLDVTIRQKAAASGAAP